MSKRGNGEGTIYYSEKLDRWVGQFVAGRKDNGKINRKSVYGKTRKEVKEKINQALLEVQDEKFIDKNDITLLEVIDLCINQLRDANRIKQVTYNRDIQTRKIIETINFAHMPIQKITITDINTGLNTLTNYSNSVIQKTYGLIRQSYNFAMINNFIKNDFFSMRGAIIKPISTKEDKKIEALDINQQKDFLNELENSNDEYKDILYIALYTGMRIGEILALSGDDIDFDNCTINISKTLTRDVNDKFTLGKTTKTYSGQREIPILSDLKPILEKYKSKKSFLFTKNGNFINPSTINSHFKRICKNADINVYTTKKKKGNDIVNLKTSKVNTHMLRHTFATRCIESGINPVVLQKILGHKNIEITLNTYTSVFDKYRDKELEKVEKYFSQLH